jgi:Lar family restriction alleviation protein
MNHPQTAATRPPLAPCPFCGSDAVLTVAFIGPAPRKFVICANLRCGCSMIPRNSERQAIEQWNRRAIQMTLVRQLSS